MPWPLDPSVYAGLLLLLGGYLLLAREFEHSRLNELWFGLGVFTIWLALETPIDSVSDCCLQSVHMFQHVLLGVVAPPLLLLGLSPPMAEALWRRVPGLRRLAEPVAAQLIAALVMIGWHLPPLYDLTLRSEAVHITEHLAFIAAGVLFWWPVVDATGRTTAWRLGDGARLLYLFIGTFAQDGVALALMFSRVPFYTFYEHAPRLVESLTVVADQTLSGAVLMLVGKVSYAIAMLAIFFRWIERERVVGAGLAPPRA
jgi:cytochrome c oxidase assembly factor CtaG